MSEKSSEHLPHPTIFHDLLDSTLPPEEKTVQRLADEAQTLVIAAHEAQAWTLTVIAFHLLSNSDVMRNLKAELLAAIPNPNVSTPLSVLQSLPYLTGIIKEGLRLSYGTSTRLQRIPFKPLIFEADNRVWTIPAGTPVGMTSVLIHQDENIFPDHRAFKPERWIENPWLERYLITFSKGSRQCLGLNLAHAEMYLWLSAIFRRFGTKDVRFEGDEGVLALVEGTDVSAVELYSDCFVPGTKPGSKGVLFHVLP